jgi:hypothetical protein
LLRRRLAGGDVAKSFSRENSKLHLCPVIAVFPIQVCALATGDAMDGELMAGTTAMLRM